MTSSTIATHTGIPTYLLVPQSDLSLPPPPVETLEQDLPLDKLAWENFERLCLRIVESESTIEQCFEYGTRGQDQHGIDLLARNRDDASISVYQCKKVKQFGPANIRDAVTKFLEGSWLATATTFVLCTSNDLRTTDCVDEINLQQKRLLEYKTAFVVWNSTELSRKLKKLPELVYDFFGPTWLVAFCGASYQDFFPKRLSPQKVQQYRSRLITFYRNIFEQNDPGIPTLTGPVAPRINLTQRYVLPDLINDETLLSSDQRSKPNAFDLAIEDDDRFGSRRLHPSQAETKESREVRISVDDWISASKRSLIVGAAGSGKTALLRHILLDLLSAEPTLPAIAEQHGRDFPHLDSFCILDSHTAQTTRRIHRRRSSGLVP